MKLNRTFGILVFIITMSISIDAQEMKPIAFDNYNPEWIHYPWVDSLGEYRQQFTELGNPYFYDEYGIFVYNNNIIAPNGYLVEKIDIETGDVIWSVSDFSEEQYTRRMVNNFKVVDDRVELYLLEESKTSNNFFYPNWDSAYVAKVIYDIDDGQLIESLSTNHDDPLNTLVKKNFFLTSNLILDGDENSYTILKSERKDFNDTIRNEYFVNLTLDMRGHIIATDTLLLTVPNFSSTLNHNYPISQGRFISSLSSVNEFVGLESSVVSTILSSDYNFDNWDTFDLSHIYDDTLISRISMVGSVDDERIIMNAATPYNATDTFISYYYLIDDKGDLLDQLEVSYLVQDRDEFVRASEYTDDDKLLGVGKYVDFDNDSISHVFVFQSDGNMGIDTLLDASTNTNDVSLFPAGIWRTDSNDVLVHFSHRQPSFPTEIDNPNFLPPDWYFYAKIKGEDLGLKTSATDNIENENVHIYPNPTTSNISINSSSKIRSLEVVDAMGHIHMRFSTTNDSLDLSALPSGQYWIKIYYDHSVTVKAFVKH